MTRDISGTAAERSQTPTIDELPASEIFVQLLRSTYRLDITDSAMLSREFRALHTLVDRVPVRRLAVPNDFDALPAVRETVIADLARIRLILILLNVPRLAAQRSSDAHFRR